MRALFISAVSDSMFKKSTIRIGSAPPTLRKAKPANSIAVREKEKRERSEYRERIEHPKPKRSHDNTPANFDDDNDPPVIKKSNNLPAVVDLDERPAFISKTQYNRLKSAFGSSAPTIIQMLDHNDSDGAMTAISRTLMQTLVDMLPVMESQVRKSKGRFGGHSFNMFVAQIREMMADMQAMQEKGLMGARIVERFLRPMFQDVAVQIVISMSTITADARKRMSDDDYSHFEKEVVGRMQSNLAEYLTQRYEAVAADITKSFT